MNAWHRRWSTHALTNFTRGADLPYTMEDGVVVTRVTPREGVIWGSSFKHSSIHLIEDLAGAWTPNGLIIGARWLCGGSSIGAKLYHPEAYWATWSQVHINGGAEGPDDVVCLKCRNVRDGVTARPCVYRAYAKSGELLYIGSTKNWEKRRAQHRTGTWWWKAVKDVDLEHFNTLAEAREAERIAIRTEGPRQNVYHNRGTA